MYGVHLLLLKDQGAYTPRLITLPGKEKLKRWMRRSFNLDYSEIYNYLRNKFLKIHYILSNMTKVHFIAWDR